MTISNHRKVRAKNEVRKTGIELIHKDPIQFKIDGKPVSLGKFKKIEEKTPENKNAIYISVKQKAITEVIAFKLTIC